MFNLQSVWFFRVILRGGGRLYKAEVDAIFDHLTQCQHIKYFVIIKLN